MIDDSLRGQTQDETENKPAISIPTTACPNRETVLDSSYRLLQGDTEVVEIDVDPPLLGIAMNVFPLVQERNEVILSHDRKLRGRFDASRTSVLLSPLL